MRLAYADPPYPGKAHLYSENTEVDHAALIAKLETYDGWALSTWEPALRDVIALCPPSVRVLAWCRSNEPPYHARPSRSWEPVLMMPARPASSDVRSFLVAGAPIGYMQVEGLTGQKPRTFCEWVIRCLGADRDEDELVDIFPGTGIMGETWQAWKQQLELPVQPHRTRPQHERAQLDAAHVDLIR